MKKNSKKIIVSIFLTIFLFSFFVSFKESRAEDSYLTISVNKSTIKKFETITATATSDKSIGGEVVTFSLYGVKTTCQMPEAPKTQTCSTSLTTPATLGTFPLTANINMDNIIYNSNSVSILIEPDTPATILPPGDNANTTAPVNTDTTYTPLASLPGLENTPYETKNECALGNYLNIIIKLILGISAVLAMVMITMGGIEYMTSELVSSKEAGKETLKNAILGLIIALGAYLILNTLNPQLLNICPKLPEATITIEPLYDRGFNDPKQANGESIRCTPVLSGPCSVANLTPIFGDKAVAMSKICNMESGGTSATSKTDICKPSNNSFSFGLFQVNLAANGGLAGPDCVGLFDKAVSSKDAIEPKYTSGFSCGLLSGKETLYNTCRARLLDTKTNLAIAKSLFSNSKGINNWIGDKKYCASAFK